MAGRPNKFQKDVKPRFNEIREWLKLGATDKEVAANLGIHKATFVEYKKKYPELTELLKKGRQDPVVQIKGAMLKRALGFQYEETKVTRQKTVVKGENEEDIPAVIIRTEVTTKTALPDTAAGLVLLQHWDRNDDGSTKWSRDPSQKEIKEKELEFKKQQAEESAW